MSGRCTTGYMNRSCITVCNRWVHRITLPARRLESAGKSRSAPDFVPNAKFGPSSPLRFLSDRPFPAASDLTPTSFLRIGTSSSSLLTLKSNHFRDSSQRLGSTRLKIILSTDSFIYSRLAEVAPSGSADMSTVVIVAPNEPTAVISRGAVSGSFGCGFGFFPSQGFSCTISRVSSGHLRSGSKFLSHRF